MKRRPDPGHAERGDVEGERAALEHQAFLGELVDRVALRDAVRIDRRARRRAPSPSWPDAIERFLPSMPDELAEPAAPRSSGVMSVPPATTTASA